MSEWETGSSYPKAERLKAFIALALQHQAFTKGSEVSEIRALWKMARQRVVLDERWLSTLLHEQAQEPDVASPPIPQMPNHTQVTLPPASETQEPDVASPPIPETSNYALVIVPPASEIREKRENTPTVPILFVHKDAKARKTIRQRKGLLVTLGALIFLTIIGSAGTLFFLARNNTTQVNKPSIDQAYPRYLSGHGTFAFFDPLSQQDKSLWASQYTYGLGGSCQFAGGAYHVSEQANRLFEECSARGTFNNFALEVQLTIVQGDCGGIAFRMYGLLRVYFFVICEDSTSSILKYNNSFSDHQTLYASKSPAFYMGHGLQNKIAVVASGNLMTFYANEQEIALVQDNSYASGGIALLAYPFLNIDHETDVVYSNARLWTL